MTLLLVALIAAVHSAPAPSSASSAPVWVFSTIGQSEWCPPGNVRLDLKTGKYSLTVRAARAVCNSRGLKRPVKKGRLAADRLARVREASMRAISEGTISDDCRNGGRPREAIVSNGGTPLVVLATGRDVAWTPDDRSCFTDAAWALHDALDDAFGAHD